MFALARTSGGGAVPTPIGQVRVGRGRGHGSHPESARGEERKNRNGQLDSQPASPERKDRGEINTLVSSRPKPMAFQRGLARFSFLSRAQPTYHPDNTSNVDISILKLYNGNQRTLESHLFLAFELGVHSERSTEIFFFALYCIQL